MNDRLDRLAAARGIVRSYQALGGAITRAPDDAVKALLKVLDGRNEAGEPPPFPKIWPPLPEAPEGKTCFVPGFLEEGRVWGVTCQLYSLRSGRNWGIGDFEDLACLGELAAALGADFLGVNPLHALFLADPARASPFSPSDRNFLNPLYIAVDQIEGFDPDEDADEAILSTLGYGELIDYEAVARHKLTALRRIHRRVTPSRDPAFTSFKKEGGEPLKRFALFDALSIEMVRRGFGAGWHSWPEAFQEPESGAVAQFTREHAEEIDFLMWLQWIADRQLGNAASRLRSAGMRIGLYLDLAVGTAPDGGATWADRTLTVPGVQIGAPPDMFNPDGQSWGLAPLSPAEIVDRDFQPLRHAYGRILRHAGALRIDHAMGLYRLFWIPDGFSAGEGAYVLYPMASMVRALAEVSQETRALIVGEDLGVVPEGFRDAIGKAGLLGYRLFYFERDENNFVPPENWPRSALACVGSHDTPTLAGWWTGSDIDIREEIGLFDPAAARNERRKRQVERRQAIGMLRARGIRAGEKFDEAIAAGIHRLVASSPARLVAVQMEDLLGLAAQPNIPGTVDEYPNWRRRLPLLLEELGETPAPPAIIHAISEARPRFP